MTELQRRLLLEYKQYWQRKRSDAMNSGNVELFSEAEVKLKELDEATSHWLWKP